MLSTLYATQGNVNRIGKAMGRMFDGQLFESILFIAIIPKGHLNDGYGISIRHYTKLLVTKLEFHDRNPRIPGNLTLKRGELESIAGNDVNF